MTKNKELPKIRCPYCPEIRDGWRKMSNHLIHFHGTTAEAGAAMTSQRRLAELMEKQIVHETKPAEA